MLVTEVLQQTVSEPEQQSNMLLDVLATFFEEVAEVASNTSISTEVSFYRMLCVVGPLRACSPHPPGS